MPPKTQATKANIDKYIFLFSKHASTTTSSGMTTEYNWNIDPQMINEQGTLEIAQTRFGQEAAYATATFASATSITIAVSNPTTNGYYVIRPSVTLVGGSGSGAIATAVLTNGRVSSIVVSGTMTGYVAASLPVVLIQSPPSFPHMIRVNNLHSKSIVHSDNGGTTNVVNKGVILHTGILNEEPYLPIKIVLEQQIINNISLSVDRTISGNSGIPNIIEFLFCLKLTEYEPKPLLYGSMQNVNVNQQ
jgi:hypothetical protein